MIALSPAGWVLSEVATDVVDRNITSAALARRPHQQP